MKKIVEVTSTRVFAFFPPLRSFKRLLLLCGAALAGSAAFAQAPATVPDTIAQRALACAACHGKEGRATSDGYFPRIAGKPTGYLYNQLLNFREGRRQYPLMTYMVAHLSDAYLLEIAQYFADQHPPYPPPQTLNVPLATLEQGRRLVMSGDASRKVPACIACHGNKLTGVAPAIPSLLGLPRDYLNAQFGAWKNGVRRASAPDCMAQIAKQLRAEEVSAVSAWLASQAVPNDMRPVSPAAASSAAVKLPIPCGGMSHISQ
ncbi:MAG: c-type cytochrome [Noviherbaspirillum sp.]